jgi:hypothetical protein
MASGIQLGKNVVKTHLIVAISVMLFSGLGASGAAPEDVYKGELLSFPGPWGFSIGKQGIILVNDQQLDDLTDPDKQVDLSLTGEPRVETLRQICERAKAHGQRTIIFAFDHFFNQYRKDVDHAPRKYLPDTDEYIERIGKIGTFAAQYGIGLELSLLSPLEIGKGYRQATGESGMWMHYRKGLRDPKTGAYSVELWRQTRWSNNKGPIDVEDAGVRVFAFAERALSGTPYQFVDPVSIVEISDTVGVQVYEGLRRKSGDYEAVRVRAFGEGKIDVGALDRVLVVQQYRTPELDYFSDKAQPFLHSLVDKYLAAGVKLNGLYSDEMHIQQDWGYFNHHDHGEFALRYVTPSLAARYASLYGEQYRDFAKYMVYFVYGQNDFVNDLTASQDTMHVFGDSPKAIRETALFRARYYRLLQDGVVDLFTEAKHYAEQKTGYRLEARAHATWAQSPTIDKWDVGHDSLPRNQYEYNPNFVWSNTVQQASSACFDYFKWGDFLTGNGNDHAEGGWLDRNYYGLMLACSTGIINEVPYSYGAHWGMPHELGKRRQSVVNVFGASSSPGHALVQEMQHRDVEVLMLYPIDLVAVEERFGGWMTQYAYANLISQQKLLEMGTIQDGAIQIAGRRFKTLAALFEPFPSEKLLAMMRALIDQGGRIVWSGPPPVVTAEGGDALAAWQELIGVEYVPKRNEGEMAPGRLVEFAGPLSGVQPQLIPTHFVVDRVYPVTPREGSQAVAHVQGKTVGSWRDMPAGGKALFLGFRPRDDQSKSLGYDARTWFDALNSAGAYPPSGKFAEFNDNTEVRSRTGDFICCRFPNGTIAIAPHLKDVVEDWAGGFARNNERDKEYLDRVPPPSEKLSLKDFRVNGKTVTFDGEGAVSFRTDDSGSLVAFAGQNTSGITVDGRETRLAASPLALIVFAPVASERRVDGGAVLQIMAHGQGEVKIPASGLPEKVTAYAEGATPGSRGAEVPVRIENGALIFDCGVAGGRWVYVTK